MNLELLHIISVIPSYIFSYRLPRTQESVLSQSGGMPLQLVVSPIVRPRASLDQQTSASYADLQSHSTEYISSEAIPLLLVLGKLQISKGLHTD